MARLVFTQQLRRFTETPEIDVSVARLRDALEAAFAINPRLRGYIVDEQGHLRVNVVIFIDGHPVDDRIGLSDSVMHAQHIHVLQALSGG
ncbi:MAG: MoaD/ThiS family protein [Burkholderiales bacterium]|nr:MoaD/ThiS family protein [Burkholderiales bacterium]